MLNNRKRTSPDVFTIGCALFVLLVAAASVIAAGAEIVARMP